MAQDDDLFEPRLGRSRRDDGRSARVPKVKSRIMEQTARRGGNPRRVGGGMVSSTPRSGRFNARGRGAKIAATFLRGSGWSFDRGSGMRVRPRRVAVKARVVKLAGKTKAVTAHLRYLERDGVSRDGERGRFYSTFANEADGKAFMERGQGDRHQFRLIVAPEDGAAFDNLRGATRDLMAKMEQDLGTNLDWIAVDHFDTGHPHSHILIRGVTEDGKTVNIAGDYIAHGIRHRASEIMTRALGPQSELEVQQQLSQEVDAERLTRLDRAILQRARDNAIDLRQMDAANGDGSFQQLLVSRVRQLERMELAEPAGPLAWSLSPNLEKTLTDMGRRGDIIRTMHERMTAGKFDRRPELYMIHDPASGNAPVVGKVLYRGAADDDHDRRYLIVDGIDGYTHYVDIGTSDMATPIGGLVRLESRQPSLRKADLTIVEVAAVNEGQYTIDFHLKHDRSATEDFANAHVRRLEAIRRATGAVERMPDGTWVIAPDHLDRVMDHERRQVRAEPLKIEMLSFAPIEKQTDLHAETWLDRETLAQDKLELADHGYGREVYRALQQRQQWLIEQQLVERDGDDLLIKRNMLAILRQREVRAVAGQLSKDLGIPFEEATPGKPIEGTYRRSINLASGRYALIEKSRVHIGAVAARTGEADRPHRVGHHADRRWGELDDRTPARTADRHVIGHEWGLSDILCAGP